MPRRAQTAGALPRARGRPERVRRRSSPGETGFFRNPQGLDIYFEDSGGSGLALFFVYGLGCSIRHWKYTQEHLAKSIPASGPYRQVWLDFQGHGQSKAPTAGQRLTLAAIVDDIRILCARQNIKNAVFLGQSLGGSIVLALARAHPELVKGIVLLGAPSRDPAPFLPGQPLGRWLWRSAIALNRARPQLLADGSMIPVPWVFRSVFREVVRYYGFHGDLARTEDIEEYIDKLSLVPPNLFLDLAYELRRFDAATFATSIQCPALVLAGSDDRIIPLSEAKRLAKLLPNSKLAIIANGSHCPHLDDPGRVNKLITAFLTKLGSHPAKKAGRSP